MKYARDVNGRMVDLIDTAVYEPRPGWGQTDEDLLNRIMAVVGGFAAFVAVPQGVQPYTTHAGGDYADPTTYLNPDGSDGNGVFPEPVPDENELGHIVIAEDDPI